MVIFRNINYLRNKRNFSLSIRQKPPWSILFFGADEFSLYSLKLLYSEYVNKSLLDNLEIVTTVKKQANPVQRFATNKIVVHSWPYTVPLNKYNVGVVVSFGHLIPESVINAFPYGVLNIHASLLPKWRGAAPIAYALANGDTETGVTVMRIKPKHFDIGEIVLQSKVPIKPTLKQPDLYKILGELGAKCLLSTLQQLPECLKQAKPQQDVGVSFAPKLTPEFAVIHWTKMTASQIFNLDRAVTGILAPTCFWKNIPTKLYEIQECSDDNILNKVTDDFHPGYVQYNKTLKKLTVLCANKSYITVEKIGVHGKKVMTARDFYNGFLSKVLPTERYFT